MKRLFAFVAIACGVAMLAPSAQAANPIRVFAMHAQNGSGENGTVTLIPANGKTTVEVAVVSEPDGASQPMHVHTGPCSKLGGVIKPLSPLVDGYSSTTIDMGIDKLTAGDLAVNSHKSASDLGTYTSCGDLK